MATLASKRKRDSNDMPNPRTAPGMNSTEFEDQYLHHTGEEGMDHGDSDMGFVAALAQHNEALGDGSHSHHDHIAPSGQQQPHESGPQSASDTAAAAMAQYHTMTVPQSTEQSFLTQVGEASGERPANPGDPNNPNGQSRNSFSDFDMSALKDGHPSANGETSPGLHSGGLGVPKPLVGTEEWHKVRRDNHKEVERRRRETINEGINELSKIVPGCEKNKGSILARAVQFITQLKENETQNIEKWTLEKLLTEQAIAELSSSCDKLKAECQRAWAECEQWKKAAQKAGVSIENDDKGATDGEDGD